MKSFQRCPAAYGADEVGKHNESSMVAVRHRISGSEGHGDERDLGVRFCSTRAEAAYAIRLVTQQRASLRGE